MPELRRIQNRRETTLTLLNLVRNVKALAAVTIREQQMTASALKHYQSSLDSALGLVLSRKALESEEGIPGEIHGRGTARIVLGSDQGMCGAFNQAVCRQLERPSEGPLVVVGYRAWKELEKRGFPVTETLGVPSGAVGTHRLVGALLVYLEKWQQDPLVGEVLLYLNTPSRGGEGYVAVRRRLLPLGPEWLRRIRSQSWVSRTRPIVLGSQTEVLQTLLRQWLYVNIYRALADSMVAESEARLSTMRNAESNIERKLDSLERAYRSIRQSQIDAELLDISAGFEAVMGEQ